MEKSNTHSLESEKHRSDLKFLLDAFGSCCSMDDIIASYFDAKFDLNDTCENLINLQSTKSNTLQSCDDSFNHVVGNVQSEDDYLGYDNGNNDGNIDMVKTHRLSKKKKSFASTGTISSFLGKRIIPTHQLHQPPNGACQPSKLELIQHKPLVDREVLNSPPQTDSIKDSDVAGFLFSMLQYGFNLDRAKIQEVLSSCGYNSKKCIEELLETSTLNFIKDNKSLNENVADNQSNVKSHLRQMKPPSKDPSPGEVASSLTSQEVLESLFKVPQMEEDEEIKELREKSLKSKRLYKIVSEPIVDTDSTIAIDIPKQYSCKKEEDDNFEVLKRSVKQHHNSMKEYYTAATDAFCKGDLDKSNLLEEEGHYHLKMFHEAREKSFVENTGVTRSTGDHDIFTLDLHMHGVSGALSLLKTHLQSIATNFSYLRVIVDSDSEDTTKGKRKLSVIKFLRRKKILWSEEKENPGVLRIKMDLIDPVIFKQNND